jgi:hypothetical protein
LQVEIPGIETRMIYHPNREGHVEVVDYSLIATDSEIAHVIALLERVPTLYFPHMLIWISPSVSVRRWFSV